MELQDKIIRMNEYRPFKSVLLNKITGNSSRIIMKRLTNIILPHYFHKHPGIDLYRKAQTEGRVSDAVVSMTSFPQRIDVVWLVIECLLRQTCVPRKIVVWLSYDQFLANNDVPSTLKSYPKDIVEVRMVDGDIRSHKKYWYAVEEFKNSPLVLVDDDIVYDSHFLEDIERVAKENKNVIGCCWGGRMRWNDDGTIMPYSQWGGGKPALGEVSVEFFYGSGGGTYFPVGSLEGAHHPKEEIMKICPTADDIWLNAITRKNGYRTCLVRNFKGMMEWRIKGNMKLHTINNVGLQNDKQLSEVRKYMQEVYNMDPFKK